MYLAVVAVDVASATPQHSIFIWDAIEYFLIIRLDGHTRDINTICFSQEGDLLVSGSGDYTVKLWNMNLIGGAEDICVNSLNVGSIVYSVRLSSCVPMLVAVQCQRGVAVWNLECNENVWSNDHRVGMYCGVAFCGPNDGNIVSIFGDYETNVLKVWTTDSGKQVQFINNNYDGARMTVSIVTSPCGGFIATRNDKSVIIVYASETMTRLWEFCSTRVHQVDEIGFSSSVGKELQLFYVSIGKYERVIGLVPVAYTTSDNATDAAKDGQEEIITITGGVNKASPRCDICPSDGKLMATFTGGQLCIQEVRTGEIVCALEPRVRRLAAVCYSNAASVVLM